VRDDVLLEVQEVIKECLLGAGVEAKIISSGAGSWRFVDVIALRAGKAEATDYCRYVMGFSKHRTLTCGYSESDISLLVEGTKVVIVGNAQQARSFCFAFF
jgi:hydroxymethylpyrimidine pyrophosphatase-like HAD family hydrolase